MIIPNGDILSEQIVNWIHSHNQRLLALEIKGSDDMEQACSVVKQAVLGSRYIVKKREPQVLFMKLKENGFTLKVFSGVER